MCKQLIVQIGCKTLLHSGITFAKKIVVLSVKQNPNIQIKSSNYCSYLKIFMCCYLSIMKKHIYSLLMSVQDLLLLLIISRTIYLAGAILFLPHFIPCWFWLRLSSFSSQYVVGRGLCFRFVPNTAGMVLLLLSITQSLFWPFVLLTPPSHEGAGSAQEVERDPRQDSRPQLTQGPQQIKGMDNRKQKKNRLRQ